MAHENLVGAWGRREGVGLTGETGELGTEGERAWENERGERGGAREGERVCENERDERGAGEEGNGERVRGEVVATTRDESILFTE
jgi:hypothetical protein